MKVLDITLDIEPSRTTHQAALRVMKRRGGGFFVGKYAKSGAAKWSDLFRSKIRQHKPVKPIEGPLHIEISFCFPHLKSTPKSMLDKVLWKATRPDLDNMEKGVLDALTKEGFMVDDGQIASKSTFKTHGPANHVGIQIVMYTLDTVVAGHNS